MQVWIAVDVDNVDPPEGLVSVERDGDVGSGEPFSGWLELVVVLQTVLTGGSAAS